ncbi:MAG: NAD(P)-dependent oxidoreductase [Armatimonadetes bacterium]|nr:MAG: NAD(P)-dependent oxidoreductase [Armatimonadota bacterium]
MASQEKQQDSPQISFLGLGHMGVPMATNLARAGYDVTSWNRTPKNVESLVAAGASIVSEASEAARGADVVITMLKTDTAVRSVLFSSGVFEAMKPGATVIDMSSIPPDTAIECAEKLAASGVSWLDAPVSGGTRGAAAGTLTIMVGGTTETYDRCHAILKTMGTVTHIGPAGAGQVAKIANQIIVATTIGGVAEALLLTIAAGLDPTTVRQALKGGFADSRILEEHGHRMIARDFAPGGSVEVQLKDLNTALAKARELDLVLPLTEQVTSEFQALADSGNNDADHSALILELERMRGVHTGPSSELKP